MENKNVNLYQPQDPFVLYNEDGTEFDIRNYLPTHTIMGMHIKQLNLGMAGSIDTICYDTTGFQIVYIDRTKWRINYSWFD